MDITTVADTFSVTSCELQHDGRFFLLKGVDSDGVDSDVLEVENFLDAPDTEWPLGGYKVALFVHVAWPENHIAEVTDEKSERLGLAFSAQALSSAQSPLKAKRAHNAYGNLALRLVCSSEILSGKRSAEPSGTTATLSELLPIGTVVVIFDVESCNKALGTVDWEHFLQNHLASFAKSELFMLGPGSVKEANRVPVSQSKDEINRKIKLVPMSNALPVGASVFLSSVLLNRSPYENHAAFRFFLAYQFVEALMQEVLEMTMLDLSVKSSQFQSYELKELVDRYQAAIKESARLKSIIRSNVSFQRNFESLTVACNDLLASCNMKVRPGDHSAIYAVRNVVFHNFGLVSENELLDEVAWQLFRLVCSLAEGYTKPTVDLA